VYTTVFRVVAEFEHLPVRGAKVLPGIAARAALPTADQLDAGPPQLFGRRLDVIDKKPRDHLAVSELLR
jgi:hypothetical protein